MLVSKLRVVVVVYSSRNEYYLGGIIALLLQDYRTMSTKSVCNNQYTRFGTLSL